MAEPGKIQGLTSEPEDQTGWLDGYLRRRARLASLGSTFECDPECSRPGCRHGEVQIPASLLDLLGAAGLYREPVSELYRGHYYVGLFIDDRTDWLRRVTLRLKKPCPFLKDDLCGIYPVRPLACMLFPEYLVSRGTFAAQAGNAAFKDFLCLRRAVELSPERLRAVAELRELYERELLLTSFFLFNHGACYVDVSTIVKEGLQGGGAAGGASAKEKPGPPQSWANQELEDFFQERLALHPPFAGVGEKISHLDTQEGRAQLLRLFQDERLFRRLRQDGDDRAFVYQLKHGKLQGKKRGIVPLEYKFI
jgi:Fe-S-cluster containining protein